MRVDLLITNGEYQIMLRSENKYDDELISMMAQADIKEKTLQPGFSKRKNGLYMNVDSGNALVIVLAKPKTTEEI